MLAAVRRAALALLLGTVVGFALCEAVVRLSGSRVERARRATVFDPSYGRVRRDSWMFDFQVPPGAVRVRVHGRDVQLPKPADELRVLFVGDSGTEGVLVSPDDTFPARFEQRMRARLPGLRSINAGVFGMTTLDELHFYEHKLRALTPDVVVLGLFMSNDINFNLAHVERELRLQSRWAMLEWLQAHSAFVHFASLQLLAANARHHLFEPGDGLAAHLLPRELTLVDRNGLHMLSYPMGEVATYVRVPSPLVDHAFDVLRLALSRFMAAAERDGFALRVLLIPSPSAVAGRLRLLHYPDIYEDLKRAGVSLSESDLDVGLPTRRVLSMCAELGLVCIDPTARFQALGEGVFFPDDEHPTALGHAVLAEALAEGFE